MPEAEATEEEDAALPDDEVVPRRSAKSLSSSCSSSAAGSVTFGEGIGGIICFLFEDARLNLFCVRLLCQCDKVVRSCVSYTVNGRDVGWLGRSTY